MTGIIRRRWNGNGHISSDDPRWSARQIIEISGASADPDAQFVGTSPAVGDHGRTGAVVPALPTTGSANRYLFLLAGLDIPNNAAVSIQGMRQLATLRADLPQGDADWYVNQVQETIPQVFATGNPTLANQVIQIRITTAGVQGVAEFEWKASTDIAWTGPVVIPVGAPSTVVLGASGVTLSFAAGLYPLTPEGEIAYEFVASYCTIPVELDVTSPQWSFTDGNISWHLRFVPHGVQGNTTFSTGLVTRPILAGDSYKAPNNGQPYGEAVGAFGTFTDIRFPWQIGDTSVMSDVINGPGQLIFYASVKQTDPENRCAYDLSGISDLGALRPEDRFVGQFPEARYGRVAGSIIVEILPESVVKPRG